MGVEELSGASPPPPSPREEEQGCNRHEEEEEEEEMLGIQLVIHQALHLPMLNNNGWVWYALAGVAL